MGLAFGKRKSTIRFAEKIKFENYFKIDGQENKKKAKSMKKDTSANSPTIKEFMNAVDRQLQSLPVEALRSVILNWARGTPPARRNNFLAMLVPMTPLPLTSTTDESLLEDIEELSEHVESGELCEGFGWDPKIQDERDFGDESWAEDVDDFLARANLELAKGHFEIARQAYEGIFDILAMGEEVEHLPGPPDPEELLKTD